MFDQFSLSHRWKRLTNALSRGISTPFGGSCRRLRRSYSVLPALVEELEQRRLLTTLTIEDVTQAEGNDGDTEFTFTVSLDGDIADDLTFDFEIVADTADAADFGGSLPTGSGTILAGSVSTVITINVSGDMVVEDDETFFVELSNIQSGELPLEFAANDLARVEMNELGFFNTPTSAIGVDVVDDVAFVADNFQGLRIVDVMDPAMLAELGFVDPFGSGRGVQVVGDSAYFAGGAGGLRILDVSDSANPVEIGFFDTTGFTSDVHVVGDTAYVASGLTGLRIIDITDPTMPTEIGFFDTPGSSFSVQVIDNTAYIADGEAGLRIVDISDPAMPSEIGFFETSEDFNQMDAALDVQVEGTIAYLAANFSGLRIIDLSNPAMPMEIAVFDTVSDASSVQVVGDLAYVTDTSLGLRVLNVSDSATPTELGFLNTQGFATQVDVVDQTAYVAADSAGVRILNLEPVLRAMGTISNDDLGPDMGEFETNSIPPTSINGNFRQILAGNFDGIPATIGTQDDLFFWDPLTGENRVIFGDASRTLQNSVVSPTAINGGDFTEVLAGDFDGGGNTDLFFWNPQTGKNRLFHFNGGAGTVMSSFETDLVERTQINGNDFTAALVGNFDDTAAEDVFFWNPLTGKNRIVHFSAVMPGSTSEISSVQDSVIDPTQINGNDFQSISVGNFDGNLDGLLFFNLESGQNRQAVFANMGGMTTLDSVRNGDATLLNGSVYNTIEIADLNGDGLDDVFAWNSSSGLNRSVLSNAAPNSPSTFVDNVFASATINGNFERVVRLTEDVFSAGVADDLFFWDPISGANRTGSL